MFIQIVFSAVKMEIICQVCEIQKRKNRNIQRKYAEIRHFQNFIEPLHNTGYAKQAGY